MAVEWHDPGVIVPAVMAWTGVLITALRWSLGRNLREVERSISEASAKAVNANKEAGLLKDEFSRALADFDKELQRRCAGHSGRLNETEVKVERIGSEVHSLPSYGAFMDISKRIEQLHGDVHEVAGRLDGIGRAVDLMNEFLINNGRGK